MNKQHFTLMMAAFFIAGLCGSSSAQLIDRGNGFVYDSDLDITYYDFAYGPANWAAASAWAEALEVEGYDDWRLPKMKNDPPNYAQDCSLKPYSDTSTSADRGWNKASSELGHLFFEELDGVSNYSVNDCVNPSDTFGLLNGTGPFQALQSGPWLWMSNQFGGHHWVFHMGAGSQGTGDDNALGHAMAVRDGDVQQVPLGQLQDRGNGLIYDADLDITYYDFSYGPTDWTTASAWADDLVVGGFDDWRLPKMKNDPPNSDQDCAFKSYFDVTTSADRGWNKASSEIGHLYYEELGAVSNYPFNDCVNPNDTFGPVDETAPFQNLESTLHYWMSNPRDSHHWVFNPAVGSQGSAINNAPGYAIAVRDGDVASVQDASASDYYPMSLGDFWVLHSDWNEGVSTRHEFERTDTILGEEYLLRSTTMTRDDGTDEWDAFNWLREDTSGVLLGAFSMERNLGSATMFDPPTYYFANVQVNFGYAGDSYLPAAGAHYWISTESVSETVEVPAGTFNDCLKIKQMSTNLAGDTLRVDYYYYAQGIGPVLEVVTVPDSLASRWELTEYSVATTNAAPTASFTPSSTSIPTEITFDGSGSSDPNGDPLTYSWDFGDGETATGATATHTYTYSGYFSVSLVVNDGTLTDSATGTIYIAGPNVTPNAAPTASFSTSPTSGQAPVEITFDASGSSDPNGDVLTCTWDFGDGETGAGVTATHTYTSSGEYVVSLTVSDGTLTDSATATMSIASGVYVESAEIPTEFRLDAAYPNPFNPVTTIGYAVPISSQVRLTVTDLLGRTVAVLRDDTAVYPGLYTMRFVARDLSSGIYIVRMEAGDFVQTRRIVLLK